MVVGLFSIHPFSIQILQAGSPPRSRPLGNRLRIEWNGGLCVFACLLLGVGCKPGLICPTCLSCLSIPKAIQPVFFRFSARISKDCSGVTIYSAHETGLYTISGSGRRDHILTFQHYLEDNFRDEERKVARKTKAFNCKSTNYAQAFKDLFLPQLERDDVIE